MIQAFAPSDVSVKAVKAWLSWHGIDQVVHSDNRQWLAFDISASRAEALFETEYFEHRNQKRTFDVSCDE